MPKHKKMKGRAPRSRARRVSGRSKARPGPPKAKKKGGSKVAGYFKDAGRSIGIMAGFPALGERIGGVAGQLYNRITGHGDYKILQNSLLLPGGVPQFGDSNIRIKKKEFLGDVKSTTGFSVQSYSVNPGLVATLPWLAAIASNYQQYVIHGMIYEFVSTSADALNSTNTALGKLIMATDYNVNNPPFASTTAMLATKFCNLGKPAANLIHAIECDTKQNPVGVLNVRTTDLASGDPLKLYDLCNFQIATDGMQAAATIGSLFVSYDIELIKPILTPLSPVAIAAQTYHSWSGAPIGADMKLTPLVSLGPDFATLGFDGVFGRNTITFNDGAPEGSYLFLFFGYKASGGSGGIGTFQPTYTDLTPIPTFYNSSGSPSGNPDCAVSQSGIGQMYAVEFGVSGSNPIFAFNWSANTSTGWTWDIELVHIAGATPEAKLHMERERHRMEQLSAPSHIVRRLELLEHALARERKMEIVEDQRSLSRERASERKSAYPVKSWGAGSAFPDKSRDSE